MSRVRIGDRGPAGASLTVEQRWAVFGTHTHETSSQPLQSLRNHFSACAISLQELRAV